MQNQLNFQRKKKKLSQESTEDIDQSKSVNTSQSDAPPEEVQKENVDYLRSLISASESEKALMEEENVEAYAIYGDDEEEEEDYENE